MIVCLWQFFKIIPRKTKTVDLNLIQWIQFFLVKTKFLRLKVKMAETKAIIKLTHGWVCYIKINTRQLNYKTNKNRIILIMNLLWQKVLILSCELEFKVHLITPENLFMSIKIYFRNKYGLQLVDFQIVFLFQSQ